LLHSICDELKLLAESYRFKLANLLCGITIISETDSTMTDMHTARIDKDDYKEAREGLGRNDSSL